MPTLPPPRSGTGAAAPSGRVLPGGLERLLRQEVLTHKLAAPRGHLAPVLRAGTPGGGDATAWEFRPSVGDPLDHDSRVEVAVALANRARADCPAPLLWLSRSGELEPAPCDLEWQAAGCAAWREVGLEPSFVVLTRHGWRHHPSGAARTWKRLRPSR